MQSELMDSAYEMAAKGRELIAAGRTAQANALLTGYMSESFGRAMEIASNLEQKAIAQ